MNKILAFILALVSLLIAGYILLDFQGLGFPDGHLTEFELALEKLYPVYIVIYLLYSGYFFYLGYTSGKNTAYAKPKWAIFSFIALLLLMLTLNDQLAIGLDNGGGGI